MPKIPGVNHLRAIRAFEKAGFKVIRQGKHVVMSDGIHFITVPRHNPVNAITMGGIVKDAGLTPLSPKSYSDTEIRQGILLNFSFFLLPLFAPPVSMSICFSM